ncbi:MAG: FCD domain-containing protein [Pseudomonadota bacterium]
MTAQVYERLRSDIICGLLPPGSRLKISELRARLDTGTSPIREALSLLTSDRLVERIDQRGFRVAVASEAAFQELLTTRAWLEERALRESIANGGPDWEETIVLSHYRLSRIPRHGGEDATNGPNAWEDCHRTFHFALLSACGSSIMLRFCTELYDQNIRYRHLAGRQAYPRRNIQREHQDIMQAALDRDADAAVEALLSHYRRTGSFLSPKID